MSRSATVVTDGYIKVDGGAMFGRVPRQSWMAALTPDRQNRLTLGLNCLLLRSGDHTVLVDTGFGQMREPGDAEAYGQSPSRLLRSLKQLRVSPRDVNAVVLTHLHNAHAGGSVKMNNAGDCSLVFPNATHYVQRASWEDACRPARRNASAYRHNVTETLSGSKRLELLDGDTELFPNLQVIVTGGHCHGHQIALCSDGGERIIYLGDLVPTPHHMSELVASSYDYEPDALVEQKEEILTYAAQHGALLVFAHGSDDLHAGYWESTRKGFCLRPAPLQ